MSKKQEESSRKQIPINLVPNAICEVCGDVEPEDNVDLWLCSCETREKTIIYKSHMGYIDEVIKRFEGER